MDVITILFRPGRISEEYFCADFNSTLARDLLIQTFATAAATETLESGKKFTTTERVKEEG